jgi:hypothetical protein
MSSKIRALLRDERLSVDVIEATGDCFYAAVSRALGLDAQVLRDQVAEELDEPQLETFRMLSEAGVEDYDFVRSQRNRKRKRTQEGMEWEDLQGVRDKLKISGKTSGAVACVWADEWAIRMVCQHLQLGLVSAYTITRSSHCIVAIACS